MPNSFPYTATGNDNPSSTWLGVWSWCWSGTNSGPQPTLNDWVIATQKYAFPVAAAQPPGGNSPTLDALDDRLDQLENLGGTLYTTVESAVGGLVHGHRVILDGVAWFSINTAPTPPTVAAQGYVAIQNTNLLAPAMWCNGFVATIVYSETSSVLNPSAGYAFGFCPGPISPVGLPPGGKGSGPLTDVFGRFHNWGLYSTVAPDPEATRLFDFHPHLDGHRIHSAAGRLG